MRSSFNYNHRSTGFTLTPHCAIPVILLVGLGMWNSIGMMVSNLKHDLFFSTSVHLNGTQCTVVCNDVSKSVKYRNIRLCHLIWPRNRLSALVFSGVSAPRIALTLSRSTMIPSLLSMWPNIVPLVTPNVHFVEIGLKCRCWSDISSFELLSMCKSGISLTSS